MFELQTAEQVCELLIRAQCVKARIHFEIDHALFAVVTGFVEPLKRPIFVA